MQSQHSRGKGRKMATGSRTAWTAHCEPSPLSPSRVDRCTADQHPRMRKPDGSWEITVNYRGLNKVTLATHATPPNIAFFFF